MAFVAPTAVLPASPSLEQLRKQAKDLHRAARAGDRAAGSRLILNVPRFRTLLPEAVPGAAPTLTEAQLVIARELGFPSWPKLKAHVERVATARTRPFRCEPDYFEDRAGGLLSFVQAGLPESLALVRRFHPKYASASEDLLQSVVTVDDTRLVYARQHGFDSWTAFRSFLTDLGKGETAEPMHEACLAVEAADLPKLRQVFAREPGLARALGTNGHTVLHLAGSSLECRERTMLPEPAIGKRAEGLAIIRFLLEAGSDPNAANDRGAIPLHQAGYGNDPDLARLLLDAGASTEKEAHGTGGTPLAFALFWGHKEVAEVLAETGIHPVNLRIAAGMNRVDLLESLVKAGKLTAQAKQSRGFYRPHSGFPIWRQTDDDAEVLAEALTWAARRDSIAALDFLLDYGADPNADPYRGTALIWAATKGRKAAVELLLERGAELNHRATFGGPGHGNGVTALHLAANSGHTEMCKLLIDRGADATLKDEMHGGDPAGWAQFFGHAELARQIRHWAGMP